MSWEAMAAVNRMTQKLSPYERFLLLFLAYMAHDEDQTFWPSLGHLSAKTGICRNTILKYLRHYEAQGLISVESRVRENGTKQSNRYTFHPQAAGLYTPSPVGMGKASKPQQIDQGSALVGGEVVQPLGGGSALVGGRVVHSLGGLEDLKEDLIEDKEYIYRRSANEMEWPERFALTAKMYGYAKDRNVVDPVRTFEHFKNHHQANGKKFKDWEAAWRTWVLSPINKNPYTPHNKVNATLQASRDLIASIGITGGLTSESECQDDDS